MKKEQEIIFLSVLENNQEKLFRICSIYAKDDEDAKDLFQEVLIIQILSFFSIQKML